MGLDQKSATKTTIKKTEQLDSTKSLLSNSRTKKKWNEYIQTDLDPGNNKNTTYQSLWSTAVLIACRGKYRANDFRLTHTTQLQTKIKESKIGKNGGKNQGRWRLEDWQIQLSFKEKF